MRAILVVAVVVLVMVLVGWITFGLMPERATINIETEKIEEDTGEMVESGKKLIREAGKAVDEAVETEKEQATEPVTPAEPAQTGRQ